MCSERRERYTRHSRVGSIIKTKKVFYELIRNASLIIHCLCLENDQWSNNDLWLRHNSFLIERNLLMCYTSSEWIRKWFFFVFFAECLGLDSFYGNKIALLSELQCDFHILCGKKFIFCLRIWKFFLNYFQLILGCLPFDRLLFWFGAPIIDI